MSRKRARKEESRLAILDAAAELFRVQGFSATGVDELMAKAGLTAGAFYAHFKSKRDLFDQTLEHMLAGSSRRLLAGVEGLKGRKLIEAMLERYVSELHRDKPELGCAIPAIACEIARHSKRGRDSIGKYVARWAELYAGHLEGRPEERRAQALRLISQAVGAVLLARLVPEALSKEVLAAGRSGVKL